MGSFVSLNTALSALYAQQHGLDVTGQNIANANTDGYSRQRVRLESVGGANAAAIFSRSLSPGGGVRAVAFERLRDAFLEYRNLQEQSIDANLRTTQSVLSRVELSFAEPGDNGLQAQLSAFWASWDDVANRPGDVGARSQVLELASTVATGFNRVATDLASLRSSSAVQLVSRIDQVNANAQRIAELNNQIQSSVNAGLSPNDLLDQRDRLIGELARTIGATTRDGEAGAVDVYVDGSALVRGSMVEALGVTPTEVVGRDDRVQLQWTRLGIPVGTAGGEVGALVDAIDVGIPVWQTRLDAAAQRVADAVNDLHTQGFDADGAAGGPVFGTAGSQGAAAGLRVVLSDPAKLAAASAGEGSLGGGNALKIAKLATAGGDSPDMVYAQVVNLLGTEAQRANRRVDIQAQITQQVDAARQAQSSVNLDEEMTSMLAFQHAYSAAAKYLSTVDETLDILLRMV